MIFQKDLREESKWMRSRQLELKEQQKRYPLFKLMKTKNDGKVVYYKVYRAEGKRKRKIVKPKGTEFYDILKGICINTKLKMVDADLNILENIQHLYRDISPTELMTEVYRDNPRLDIHDISIAVSELEQIKYEPSEWARAQYKMSEYKPEEKIHTTSRGLKVRSKSEVSICEVLYANGIEFRYEEVIYLNGRRIVPDFTIRRKSDGKIFYWEHCGLMDDLIYRRRYYEKTDLYTCCDIVPWDNLILTYDKDGSIDLEYVEAIVRTILIA